MKARDRNETLKDWVASLLQQQDPNAVYSGIPGGIARPTCRLARLRNRDGKCHQLSAKGAIETCSAGDGWEVVSGLVDFRPGVPMVHSWLRQGGFVYDPVLDKFYVNEISYAHAVAAVPVVSYSAKQVAQMVSRDRHWGPWWPALTETELPAAMRRGSPFREALFENSRPVKA